QLLHNVSKNMRELNDMKKPFYKRWWFIAIVVFLVMGGLGALIDEEKTTSDEEAAEVSSKQEEKQQAEKETAKETAKETIDESKESESNEPKEKVIELKEEIPFVDFTAKIQRIKINDDTLTIVLDWTNQSEYEQAHFSLLAGIDVYQDDDILEMTKGEERLLKRIPKNQFDVVDLEYKLKDNETPVRVRIIPWNEYDEPKETTIEIN